MRSKDIFRFSVLIPFVFGLTACGNKKVDVNEYLDISYHGYDSIATASYTIDYEEMVEENLKAFDLDKDSSERAFERAVEKLEEIINGELDKTDGLSNGDKVKFKWDIDTDKLEEEFPVKLLFADKEFEVKKLEEGEVFDPFDDFVITFEGISPDGVIKVERKSDIRLDQLQLEADNPVGLSNGQIVKLKVTKYYENNPAEVLQYCGENGMVPERLEKEVKVEGLFSYVTKLSQISEDTLNEINSSTRAYLDKRVNDFWGENEKLTGLTPIGNYLLVQKGSEKRISGYNGLYSIYKVDVENGDGALSYFYYSFYPNLTIDDKGKCPLDMNYMRMPDGGSMFGSAFGEAFYCDSGNYFYVGYKDLDQLFNDKVTSVSESYDYESTVKE